MPPGPFLRPSSSAGFSLLEIVVVLFVLALIAGLVVTQTSGVVDRAPLETTLASMVTLREVMCSRYYPDVGEMPLMLADLFRRRPALPPLPEVPEATTPLAPGWRGPYVLNTGAVYRNVDTTKTPPESWPSFLPGYGPLEASLGPAPAIDDGWRRPIVLQIPNWVWTPGASLPSPAQWRHMRLVSAGPNGVIDTPLLDADATGAEFPPEYPAAFFPNRSLCKDDIVVYVRVADLRRGVSP